MNSYNLFDLLSRITEIINDGYFYAEISELPSDDEFPVSLSFSAFSYDETLHANYDEVEALPSDYDYSQKLFIPSDSPCYSLSLPEVQTVLCALDNALEYFKECSYNKSGLYDRETLNHIKASSVHCRNLQAKVRKFLNGVK